jgi:two-component system cell cycle sensor histidine kinase/response regulator CckA
MTKPAATVVVIEDYDDLRELAEEVLRNAGYTVLAFRNAASAIGAMGRHAGSIDLLLTDVELPDISGPEVADTLKATHPAMKVLLMSGYAEVSDGNTPSRWQDMPLIQKPFMAADLVRKIREILVG